MKGFFIFLVIFVGSIVGFMTSYQEIGQWYMEKVVVDEGGPYPNATFDKLKTDNPDAFKVKFDSDLTARIKIAKFADLLDKESFYIKIAEETNTMYANSPLAKREDFEDMVFDLAEYYYQEDHFRDAYALFKVFMDAYPDSKHMQDVKRDSDHLRFKYSL